MPLFSAFTPFCGGFAFSSRPSHSEMIYRSIVGSLSKAYDMSPGTRQEALAYMQARGLARARYILDRAANQQDPNLAVEMLPELERDWGVIPGEFDSIRTRQKNVAAAQAILRGSRLEALIDSLQTLLGPNFVEVRMTKPSELAFTQGTANFARPDIPPKFVRLIDPVAITGSLQAIKYEGINDLATTLTVGDAVVVGGENSATSEVVTVAAVDPVAGTFSATFTKAHDIGAICTTGNFVRWTSNQRHVHVVVTASVVSNPVTRGRIHRLMARILRGVTTWSIVSPASSTIIGPLTVGVTPMGTTCIGTIPI